jgi:hypothetical protein
MVGGVVRSNGRLAPLLPVYMPFRLSYIPKRSAALLIFAEKTETGK